jgi:hypothetical protein
MRHFNAAGADPDGELREEHDPETYLIPMAIRASLGQIPALPIYGCEYPTPDGTAGGTPTTQQLTPPHASFPLRPRKVTGLLLSMCKVVNLHRPRRPNWKIGKVRSQAGSTELSTGCAWHRAAETNLSKFWPGNCLDD